MSNIDDAFDMLLEEFESEMELIHQQSVKMLEKKEYEKATKIIEQVGKIKALHSQIENLRREWNELFWKSPNRKSRKNTAQPKARRLGRGIKTPQTAYYLPILKALELMGGKGSVTEVLEKVGRIMQGNLKDVDFESLPSNSTVKRWENSAQWARNSMVHDGLLKKDSPHGIWEITEAGRRKIREQS